MRVEVTLSAQLHELANAIKLVVDLPEGSTVLDLIRALGRIDGRITELVLRGDRLNENYLVIVNGRDVQWLGGLGARLHDGDKVLIAPRVLVS